MARSERCKSVDGSGVQGESAGLKEISPRCCLGQIPSHLEQQWLRSLAPGVLLNGITQPVRVGDPPGAREKNLPLVVAFRNQHSVQPDVVHDDAVREVLNLERNE